MRAEPRCIVCTLRRGLREIEEAKAPLEVKRAAMIEVLRGVKEGFERGLTPAEIGVKRYNIIKSHLDIEERYSRLKEASQDMATRILREIREGLRDLGEEEKFHQAFLIATAANAFDFDLLDHPFTINDFQRSLQEFNLAIDHRQMVLERVWKKPRILYLLDNAGEVVFDLEFIGVLEEMGSRVTLGVKGYRFQNDVTKEDLEEWGYLGRIERLFTIDAYFHNLGDALRETNQYDLIISKGMFNFEILEEKIEEDIVFALTAKCLPVANALKVKLGGGVILLRREEASKP